MKLNDRVLRLLERSGGSVRGEFIPTELADMLNVEPIAVIEALGSLADDKVVAWSRCEVQQIVRSAPARPTRRLTVPARDRIVVYLMENGGAVRDPAGQVMRMLERDLGLSYRTLMPALEKLEGAGLIRRDASRQYGTREIRLLRKRVPA